MACIFKAMTNHLKKPKLISFIYNPKEQYFETFAVILFKSTVMLEKKLKLNTIHCTSENLLCLVPVKGIKYSF